MRYAGFLRRLVAAIIDAILTYIAVFALMFPLALLLPPPPPDQPAMQDGVAGLVALILFWLYFAFMESSPRQATLGKMVIGIKVIDLDGGRISFARATGRCLAKVLSGAILMIGFIMAAFTRRKQALHDLLVGTLVVMK